MGAHNCSIVAEQDITRALRDCEPVQTGCDLVRRRLGGARLLLELHQLHCLAVQRQVKCLHSYNDLLNVYTRTATGQLFTLIQQQVNCLHSYNDRSNVNTHTTTDQMFTLIQQQLKCLHSYNNRSNVYNHTMTGCNFNTQDYIQKCIV